MTGSATLGALRARYDTLFCDVWGVIRDGRSLLPDAVASLVNFRREGGQVCLVSNSPRLAPSLAAMLAEMGLDSQAYDAIATSGDAIRHELEIRSPGRALRIGPDFDEGLYDGLNLEFTDIGSADFLTVTGPDDYWNGTPEDYEGVLESALSRDLDLVCANPDIVVQAGDRLIYCAGAIARAYRKMGGRSIVAGKPHTPIYALARERLMAATGQSGTPDRTLAIGDGPETDLKGAKRAGVDALFIAEGILGEDMVLDGFDPAAVRRVLSDYGSDARWVAPRLVWD